MYEIIQPNPDLENPEFEKVSNGKGTTQGWEKKTGVRIGHFDEDTTITLSDGISFWLPTKRKVTIAEMEAEGWVMVYDTGRKPKRNRQ